MRKKYFKISILCLSLAIAAAGVVLGVRTPFSSAAGVTVRLLVPVPVCGNGIKEGDAEQCDDGNLIDGDGCDHDCTGISCGNGVIQPGEECDDNNFISGDGCSATCTVQSGWVCLGASSVCHLISCGDGVADVGEQCDDGNANNLDACTNSCMNAVCGDTLIRTGAEQCDDGNANNLDACTNSCMNAVCGDTLIRTGAEQCDDGGIVNGDGCDSECYSEVCGNGRVQLGEPCDDGNLINGDGCSGACAVEAGFVCSGSPSCCAVCGDGTRQCAEQCDDGKQCTNRAVCTLNADCLGIGDFLCTTRSNDGCSATCANEGGGPPPARDIIITQITAYPEQRFGAAGTNYDTQYTFSVLTPDNQSHQALYSESSLRFTQNSGIGYPFVTIGGIAAGTYDVTLKTTAHLTTMLDNVYLIAGENPLNFTNAANLPQIGPIVLSAGDLDNTASSPGALGDDVINSVDISVLLQKIGTQDPTGNNIRANLNQDTIVDTADLNILLNNLDKEANY